MLLGKGPMGARPLFALFWFGILAMGALATLPFRAQVKDPPEPQRAEQAAPPGTPATEPPQDGPPSDKKGSFEWRFAWEGWKGLQYKAVKDTRSETKVETPAGASFFDFTQLAITGKFGAKIGVDGAAFWKRQNLDGAGNGWEVRRARFYMAGDVVLLTPWSFRIEFGKTGKVFTLEESYLVFKSFPKVGFLQVGQFQAPMSLEATAASRDYTFMEQSSAVMALAPGTNTGFQLGRPAFDERMTWTIGLFTNIPVTETGDATKEARRAMGRLTWLAKDETAAEVPGLFHLGLSVSNLYSGDDTVQYRSRPESHLAPYMVETGEIHAQGADTVGLEAAWVDGSVSIQGECLQTWVNRNRGDGQRFWGSYVGASLFLTGETRPYSKQEGIFTRLRPSRNFSLKTGGRGALEVAVRYSVVDLNSGPTHGGKMRSFTAGLNWYLNPNAKLRFNYVAARSDMHGPTSKLNIAEMRIEFDF